MTLVVSTKQELLVDLKPEILCDCVIVVCVRLEGETVRRIFVWGKTH